MRMKAMQDVDLHRFGREYSFNLTIVQIRWRHVDDS